MARAVLWKRFVAIDAIEIDACLDETHTMDNTITDHPVEEGFNVTDHSRPNPDVVTLNCYVSNTPLSEEQVSRSIRAGDVDSTTSAAFSAALSSTEIAGRGANAYAKLRKLRDEGAMVTVVTTLRTYTKSDTEGMMIQNISIPRTRENFDGLEFSITLKQVRIVKNRQTSDRKQREKQTRKPKENGPKPTAPPPPKEREVSKLHKIIK